MRFSKRVAILFQLLGASLHFTVPMYLVNDTVSNWRVQNDVEHRSFITLVVLPTTVTFSDGKIRPVYIRMPSCSVEMFFVEC